MNWSLPLIITLYYAPYYLFIVKLVKIVYKQVVLTIVNAQLAHRINLNHSSISLATYFQ